MRPRHHALLRPAGVAGTTGAALVLLALTVLVSVDSQMLHIVDAAAATVVAGWPGTAAAATPMWLTITSWGAGPVLGIVGLVAAVVLAYRRWWAEALAVPAAMVAVFVLWALLRITVARLRPQGGLVSTDSEVGFPSGHASNSAAFAVLALAVLGPRLRPWLCGLLVAAIALFAFAVGLSRVVLGVHYPSDVIAGWALAGAVVPVVFVLVRTGVDRHRQRRADPGRAAPVPRAVH